MVAARWCGGGRGIKRSLRRRGDNRRRPRCCCRRLRCCCRRPRPAIAAGCPFVLKPASRTPIGAIIIGEVLAECHGTSESQQCAPDLGRQFDDTNVHVSVGLCASGTREHAASGRTYAFMVCDRIS